MTKTSADSDVYIWVSWHSMRSYLGTLIPESTMEQLCKATGGWKKFSQILIAKHRKFPDEAIRVMHKLMELPDTCFEHWDHSPWIEPTQEWVADQIREFSKWYLQTIGEPVKYDEK